MRFLRIETSGVPMCLPTAYLEGIYVCVYVCTYVYMIC